MLKVVGGVREPMLGTRVVRGRMGCRGRGGSHGGDAEAWRVGAGDTTHGVDVGQWPSGAGVWASNMRH